MGGHGEGVITHRLRNWHLHKKIENCKSLLQGGGEGGREGGGGKEGRQEGGEGEGRKGREGGKEEGGGKEERNGREGRRGREAGGNTTNK